MSEDRPSSDASGTRSWFERLGQMFNGEPRTRPELIQTLRDAQQRDIIDRDTESMLEGVIEVTEMQVRDIMIPRGQMVVLDRDDSYQEIVKVVTDSGFSRFPVIGDSRDEVVGILIAKDLLRFSCDEGRQSFDIREILRPPSFVPESKRLNVLLKEFRTSRNHIAIVVDEYGGVSGLATIEDVLEQIVGEIDDEHDVDSGDDILKYSDTRFLVRALTSIEDFNEYFGTEYSDDEFDTVGGMLMQSFGHLPKRGETVRVGNIEFGVLRADSRRIYLVQVYIRPTAPVEADS
ncbi:MAG: transporter associated domain-containing protein [Pseudomonadota bacterium]|nr:transporter associated domain-containing protein [Pseudomonadota bacterium]